MERVQFAPDLPELAVDFGHEADDNVELVTEAVQVPGLCRDMRKRELALKQLVRLEHGVGLRHRLFSHPLEFSELCIHVLLNVLFDSVPRTPHVAFLFVSLLHLRHRRPKPCILCMQRRVFTKGALTKGVHHALHIN